LSVPILKVERYEVGRATRPMIVGTGGGGVLTTGAGVGAGGRGLGDDCVGGR
jgi:hypothetical protein